MWQSSWTFELLLTKPCALHFATYWATRVGRGKRCFGLLYSGTSNKSGEEITWFQEVVLTGTVSRFLMLGVITCTLILFGFVFSTCIQIYLISFIIFHQCEKKRKLDFVKTRVRVSVKTNPTFFSHLETSHWFYIYPYSLQAPKLYKVVATWISRGTTGRSVIWWELIVCFISFHSLTNALWDILKFSLQSLSGNSLSTARSYPSLFWICIQQAQMLG